MTYQKLMTVNGYDFFEASSAFQKAVRRGDEDLALFFGVELVLSNYDEYLWKRIKIIVSEDVGLASPVLAMQIHALYSFYKELKAKKDDKHYPWRLHVVHAILLCCRSKKSRHVDWAVITYFNGHDQEMLKVPDWALDKHTQRGRSMGRGLDHFIKEGAILENHHKVDGEDEMMRLACELLKTGKKPITGQTDDMFED